MGSVRLLWVVGVAVGLAGSGCGGAVDDALCGEQGCDFTESEWTALGGLTNLPATPPADPSNKQVGVPAAELLGQKLFFDPRFSGTSIGPFDVLRRPMDHARVAQGQPLNVSCASCHNFSRGGIDSESVPGHVSIGALWMDTNALSVVNSAFYSIINWNGRNDTLWGLAVGVVEGAPMNGSRLQTAWVLQDFYAEDYRSVFGATPLPVTVRSKDVQALVETTGPKNGQCKLAPDCPLTMGCRLAPATAGGEPGCFPRFPLKGKPGSKAGCQPGDAAEPFGDAFDCMDTDDKDLVTWALVRYGKAVAAYEHLLVSRDSAFDEFIRLRSAGEPAPASFPPAAERGARLFLGKAACSDCHNTPLLSDSKFHNVGVAALGAGVPTEADCPAGGLCDCVGSAETGVNNCLPWGARDGLAKLKRNAYRRDSKFSDDSTDRSRQAFYDVTPETVRKGSWRTPSLRDVALTPPYMHNGSLRSLEEVVDHYDRGGSALAPGVRSPQIRPLFLSEQEKADLVEFLKTLTGRPLPAELTKSPPLP
jgi:cytochrome c peroxidase